VLCCASALGGAGAGLAVLLGIVGWVVRAWRVKVLVDRARPPSTAPFDRLHTGASRQEVDPSAMPRGREYGLGYAQVSWDREYGFGHAQVSWDREYGLGHAQVSWGREYGLGHAQVSWGREYGLGHAQVSWDMEYGLGKLGQGLWIGACSGAVSASAAAPHCCAGGSCRHNT
jgi:hypothetical protein